tara:strand:- start:2718 stop:3410 length:693 start_codon:yes stop_codon:yes gene_type:complete
MKKTKLNNDQIPINFSFITNKHFYNYISGNNKSIIDALSSFSSSNKTNIIFLRGNKSSGKSHLCRAIINTSKKKILYLASDDIKTVNVFEYDLLIIDGIDKLLSNYPCEEKIFSIINDFILEKKNILVTSTTKLNQIDFRIPDLASRLTWDLIFDIRELNDKDKIKVLKKYAKERGLSLSSSVCDYIMTHYKRDLYFLCNSIKFLDEKSLSLKRNITIPFIKNIIKLKNF